MKPLSSIKSTLQSLTSLARKAIETIKHSDESYLKDIDHLAKKHPNTAQAMGIKSQGEHRIDGEVVHVVSGKDIKPLPQ